MDEKLTLKIPPGWFPIGPSVLTLLRDLPARACKLAVFLLVVSNRRTGMVRMPTSELARRVGVPVKVVATTLAMLAHHGMLRFAHGSAETELAISISDEYWPYRKRTGEQPVDALCEQYVEEIQSYMKRWSCIAPGAATGSQSIAEELFRKGEPVENVKRAILLGISRKHMQMSRDAKACRIASLKYFVGPLEEARRTREGKYWEHLERRLAALNEAAPGRQ